jgi:hypothetical protein
MSDPQKPILEFATKAKGKRQKDSSFTRVSKAKTPRLYCLLYIPFPRKAVLTTLITSVPSLPNALHSSF